MANDIITIDTAVSTQVGRGTKWVYHDTAGKRWVSWADKIVLLEKHTYELQEMNPNTWSPKNKPEKKFTDYVITKAKEVAAAPVALDKQTNGKAQPAQNGRQKWDRDEVLSARLHAIVAGWAQAGQIAIDGQSVARALWALDRGFAMYSSGPPTHHDNPAPSSEDPGDGMEGTEFGR